MSNVKISQLPPVSASVQDSDVIPIVDGGQTKKVTALSLQSYTQGNSVLLTGNQSIDGIKTFIQQIISSVATGTAPFSVASTTKVTNLNADLLDGLSSADFQSALNGTGIVKSTAGTISYLTDNSSNWNTAFNDSIVSISITGTTIKTLTLNQQDGGSLSAYWDNNSGNLVTSVFGRIGDITAQSGDYTTTLVTEGTNLYYTQSRFNTAFSNKSTTDLTEGTNLYFTNDRARTAISNTVTGLTYTPLTGVLSATAGYAIPTTASQTNWDTAYTNRITSASLPLSITSNAISISQATTTTNGYLSSTDWNTFNNKQASGNYITALTGEASASGPGSASVTLLNSAVIGKVLTGLNVTGGSISASDSILSAFGKVQNQINGLVGGTIYKGTWNASTNTPTLTSSVGTQGWYYIVSVAGSTNLNGITDWNVGDWAIFDGSAWQKVDNTDSVISVNGLTGAVSLTTSNISEGTNLYYTEARVNANTNVAANTAARHNAVTLGTANGLSLSTQVLSLGLSSASANGALSSTDWSTFNAKQAALSGTGIVKSVGGTISYLTDNSTNWNTAYNHTIVSAGVTGTSTKTLTLNQQDGGTVTASWSDLGLTSVGLSMPSAFTVTNSPLTANGTLAVTGAGTTSQYVRGDGSLATFPSVASEAQRLITEVYNESGATLTKGTIVYINGGHGNLPTITKALATSDATSAQTYGVVQTDITNNNNGFVVVIGSLIDLNTNAYANGTILYLSSTIAGEWTSVKQYAPAHLVYVGIVTRSHPTQGIVEVRIQNGYEMDELHNVAAQSPSNGDILQYVTSTSLWTKTAGTTSAISEGSNLYYTDARSRSAFSESVIGLDYNSTTGVLSTTTGYGIPTTAKQTTWDTAYNDSIVSAAVTGTTTKTLTLNQQDGGTITASWNDYDTAPVTSVFGRTGVVVAASGDYTTTQVTEGTNLYYTDARFNTSFAAKSTTFLTEGTNLYYTDARARGAISLTTSGTSGVATYTSGVLNIPNYGAALSGYLPLTGGTLTGALGGTSASFSSSVTVSGTIVAGGGDILGSSATSDYGNLTLRGGYAITTAFASKIEIRGFEGGAATQGALIAYTNGTERFRINQAGTATFTGIVNANNGAIILGKIVSADYNLVSLNSTNAEGQYIGLAGGGGSDKALYYQSGNAGAHIFRTGNGTTFDERMRLLSGGNLGLGTATPNDYSIGSTAKVLQVTGSSYSIINANAGSVYAWLIADTTAAAVGTQSNHDFKITSNNVERMRFKANGRINISSLPTSSAGLSAGDIWNNLGILSIV